MLHKPREWVGWAIWSALLLYDKIVALLGRLAGPTDFAEYVAAPFWQYIWPHVQPSINAMMSWDSLRWVAFIAVSLFLAWRHKSFFASLIPTRWRQAFPLRGILGAHRRVAESNRPVKPEPAVNKDGPAALMAIETPEDLAIRDKLSVFAIDHLEPTLQVLKNLQERTARTLSPSKRIGTYACYGLESDPNFPRFIKACQCLYIDVNAGLLKKRPLSAVLELFNDIRGEYDSFSKRTLEMTNYRKLSRSDDDEWVNLWNSWAKHHNDLVDAHNALCTTVTVIHQPLARRQFREKVELIDP